MSFTTKIVHSSSWKITKNACPLRTHNLQITVIDLVLHPPATSSDDLISSPCSTARVSQSVITISAQDNSSNQKDCIKSFRWCCSLCSNLTSESLTAHVLLLLIPLENTSGLSSTVKVQNPYSKMHQLKPLSCIIKRLLHSGEEEIHVEKHSVASLQG